MQIPKSDCDIRKNYNTFGRIDLHNYKKAAAKASVASQKFYGIVLTAAFSFPSFPLSLRVQVVKQLGIIKLPDGHAQSICDLVDVHDTRILAFSTQNAFVGGHGNIRQMAQCITGKFSLLA